MLTVVMYVSRTSLVSILAAACDLSEHPVSTVPQYGATQEPSQDVRVDTIPPKPAFHQDHVDRRPHHDVILQVDGVHFWASMDMLSEKSTYFKRQGNHGKDVADGWAKAQPLIKYLPSASTASVSLLLLVVEVVCLKKPKLLSKRAATLRRLLDAISDAKDYETLGSLFTTADVFGFDSLPTDLDAQDIPDVWMATTVSLVARKRPLALESCDGVEEEVWRTIPRGAEGLLDRRVPDWRQAIDPLRQPHVAWYAVLDKIRAEGNHPHDDFSLKCSSKGCPSFKDSKGDWAALVRDCISVVIPSMWRAPRSTDSHRHMSGAVHATVDCTVCATKISLRFGLIIIKSSGLTRVSPKYY